MTSDSAPGYGSGRKNTKSATENTAVLAPTPSAVTRTAVRVKTGVRASVRLEVLDVLPDQFEVQACRRCEHVGDCLEPDREPGGQSGCLLQPPREDGGHLAPVLAAERGRQHLQEDAIGPHHERSGDRPCLRASRTSASMRASSARTTAPPNGVIR